MSPGGKRANVVVDSVHVGAQQTEDAEPDRRAFDQHALERGIVDESDSTGCRSRRCAVVRTLGDDAAQAENLSGSCDTQRLRVTFARREQKVHLSRLQHVDAARRITFAKDCFAGLQLHCGPGIREGRLDDGSAHDVTLRGVSERER